MFLAWMTGVTWLSSTPSDRMPAGGLWQYDKLIHATVFAAGGGLAWLAVRDGVVAAGAVAAFAACDEWHQASTPGRQSDVHDWIADACGAAAGAWTVSALVRRRYRSGGSVGAKRGGRQAFFVE